MLERADRERIRTEVQGEARRRRHLLGRLALLLLLPAGPAGALDFSSDHLVYREDYEGETSYPTTPEVDLAGVGGVNGGAAGPMGGVPGAPALTGSAARAFVSGASKLIEFTARAPGTVATGDFGVRGEFANLVLTGDGQAVAIVDAFEPGYELFAVLEVSRVGAVDSATLRLEEHDDFVEQSTSVALSSAQATALLGGAAFTVDLFVDRVGATGFASVEVAGFAAASQVVLSLTAPVGTPILLLQGGGHDGTSVPTSVQLDMTATETYSALPRSFNVDVGASRGTPSSTYGAAGQAGTWNTIGLGTSPLVDIDGNASAVSVTLATALDGGFAAGGSPDDGALLGDHGFQCNVDVDTWTLDFAGLPVGRYRVLVYAPANATSLTGLLDVNGIALPGLPGLTGFQLIEGLSWSRIATTTADGTLSLSGMQSAPSLCAGIAGVQLVALPPPKVPSLSRPALALLAGVLACGGATRMRRRRNA